MIHELKKSPPPHADEGEPEGAAKDRHGKHRERNERKEMRQNKFDALDRALEEGFPGSDPVSMMEPPHSVYDKQGDEAARFFPFDRFFRASP